MMDENKLNGLTTVSHSVTNNKPYTMTSAYTLSYADEALAVRLMAHEQDAWNELLASVQPTFRDPVADKLAGIMKYRMENNVEYSEMGGMIREMLYVRYQQKMDNWGDTGSQDGEIEVDEFDNICCEQDVNDRKSRFLNQLEKDKLLKLLSMDEPDRSDYINDGAGKPEADWCEYILSTGMPLAKCEQEWIQKEREKERQE